MNRNHIRAKKAKIFGKRETMPCIYCDRELDYRQATIEHIVALKDGGNNSIGNFGIACAGCNK